MTTSDIDEFVKRQKADLESRRQLAKTDPERAKREAAERLRRAGILDEEGNLMPQYR